MGELYYGMLLTVWRVVMFGLVLLSLPCKLLQKYQRHELSCVKLSMRMQQAHMFFRSRACIRL